MCGSFLIHYLNHLQPQQEQYSGLLYLRPWLSGQVVLLHELLPHLSVCIRNMLVSQNVLFYRFELYQIADSSSARNRKVCVETYQLLDVIFSDIQVLERSTFLCVF